MTQSVSDQFEPNRMSIGRTVDLRIHNPDGSGWQVELLTNQADNWAHGSLRPWTYRRVDNVITTDLVGINDLVKLARAQNLSIEYVGPKETIKL